MMLALVGTLAYEFQVVLPLLARGPLEGGAGTYGLLTSAMGAGAVVGGLVVAGRGAHRPAAPDGGRRPLRRRDPAPRPPRPRWPSPSWPSRWSARPASPSSPSATPPSSSTSDPRFRGRVMALWAVAFLGSTPARRPDHRLRCPSSISPRGGLVVGGLACLAAAGVGAIAMAREHGGDARHQPA